jgi:hypothetical protein
VSPIHRTARVAAVAALGLAPLTAFAAPVALAAAPAFHPLQHVGGTTPYFVTHGFAGTHATHATVTSTNWSGYAATGSTYTSVSTTFTQPAVTCTSSGHRRGSDSYSAFWVGLDGYSSATVEQTGTEADCAGTTAEYSAWYELYPANPVTYSNMVRPGDSITETVSFSGSDTYTMTVADSTQGWTKTTTKASAGDSRSSAEVIAEAPSSGTGVLPLADFGTVNFNGSLVNGSNLSSTSPTGINMTSSSGAAEATISAFSGDNFSIAWKSS